MTLSINTSGVTFWATASNPRISRCRNTRCASAFTSSGSTWLRPDNNANARAALQVADFGYVLETGEISLEGPSKELANDPRVIEAYLGLGGKH